MNNVIKIGSATITIEGHDFFGEERDFDAVCSRIEDELFEAAAENPRLFDELSIQGLANSVCRDTLKELGWDKPDVPFLSVSIVEAQKPQPDEGNSIVFNLD